MTGVQDVTAIIQEIWSEEIANLLVEYNAALALGLSGRASTIDDSKVVRSRPAVDSEANTAPEQCLLAA